MAFERQCDLLRQELPDLQLCQQRVDRVAAEVASKANELVELVRHSSLSCLPWLCCLHAPSPWANGGIVNVEFHLRHESVSPQEEKLLVLYLAKLECLRKLETRVEAAEEELFAQRHVFRYKAERGEEALEVDLHELGADPKELLGRFNDLWTDLLGLRPEAALSYWSNDEDPCTEWFFLGRQWRFLGSLDDLLETFCPRITRRFTWNRPIGKVNKGVGRQRKPRRKTSRKSNMRRMRFETYDL
ncbi:unnamed protein product [Durusdinium trenchii]|uniref:Uncharacterized protein n=2 Tax=Durusdinium trenchii TaxID=1381693 RepID=A0ABP0PET1_9DINO